MLLLLLSVRLLPLHHLDHADRLPLAAVHVLGDVVRLGEGGVAGEVLLAPLAGEKVEGLSLDLDPADRSKREGGVRGGGWCVEALLETGLVKSVAHASAFHCPMQHHVEFGSPRLPDALTFFSIISRY